MVYGFHPTFREIEIWASVKGKCDVFQDSLRNISCFAVWMFVSCQSIGPLLQPYQVFFEIACNIYVPVGSKIANGLQQVLVFAVLLRL